VQHFNVIVDQAIGSFNERFKQLEAHNNKFSILWKFAKVPRPELTKQCKQLEIALTDGGDCDIDGAMLADELDSFKTLIPSMARKNPRKLLQYMHKHKLCDAFPHATVALRIWLTLPVTVTSGERSFSKLKLIKTYLRSTMTQERFTNLAILSIEQGVAKTLDYSQLIDTFANLKACRITL